MKIKITSDSTCDLSEELCKKYDITKIPLTIVMGDKTYIDGVNIFPKDIFEFVETEVKKGQKMPSTSAVNVQEYGEVFDKLKKDYDAIIHISLSSEISSSYRNACLAANERENVFVVDSRHLSGASGAITLQAANLVKQNSEPKEIIEELNKMIPKIDFTFVVNRLDYLQKGGRCSSAAAITASILKINPMIAVKDGKMSIAKKYMGSFEMALKKYVSEKLTGRSDIDKKWCMIVSPGATDELFNSVKEQIKSIINFEDIIICRAGCTIASHCGPNTLGIMFATK